MAWYVSLCSKSTILCISFDCQCVVDWKLPVFKLVVEIRLEETASDIGKNVIETY